MGNLSDPTIRILSKIPEVDQQMVKTYAVLLDNIEAMAIAGAGASGSPTTPVIGPSPGNPKFFRLAGETNNAPLWQGAGVYWYSDNGSTRTGYIDMSTATVMELVNPADSALAIHLKSYENDSSGIVSTIHHYGRDDGNAEQEYARQHVVISSAGAGEEEGEFQWQLIDDGSFPSNLNQMRLRGGRTTPTDLYIQSEQGSDTDEFATIQFWGRDSQPANEQYASITAKIIDNTTTTEDGSLYFSIVKAGTVTKIVEILSTKVTMDADLEFTGAQSITNTSGDITIDGAGNFVIQDATIIDVTGTEALLVRKDSDGGDVFIVDTTNARIGVNVTPSVPLHAEDSNNPVMKIVRMTTTTNDQKGTLFFMARTSNDMADGFGTSLRFGIEDDTSGEQTIADISARRDGADNSGQMQFSTSITGTTTERMRITSAGNVGIGVTDPDELLELYKVGTQLKLSGGAADYATFAVAADGALTITTVDTDAAEGDIILMPDGYVGIGTASPSAELHIDQPSPTGAIPVLTLDQGDISEQCIQFSSDAVDRDINLFTVNVTGAPKMWWDESKDEFALDRGLNLYRDTASTTPLLVLEEDGAGDAAINFLITGIKQWSVGIDNSDADKLKFAPEAAVSTNPTLTMTTSGRVGIATDNPTHLLQITGTDGGTTGILAFLIAGVTNGFQVLTDAGNNLTYSMRTGTNAQGFYQAADGDIGIHTASPSAELHVDQPSASGAQPVLFLDQGDISEQCIQLSSDAVDRDINLFTVNVTGAPKMAWTETPDIFSLNKGIAIGDGGTTNYANFAGDGELTLFGTARTNQSVDVEPGLTKRPASNPPGEGTEDNFLTHDFNATTDESVFFHWEIPHDYASAGTIHIHFDFFVDTAPASAESVVWGTEYKKQSVGDNFDFGAGTTTAYTQESITTGTPANDKKIHRSSAINLTVTGFEPGDFVLLRFFRDADGTGGTDDYTADARIVDYHIEYIGDKLGEAT